MTKSTTLREAAVRHYLATGDHDSAFRGWPGDNIIEATRGGSAVLREALLAKVRARTASLDMLPAAQKVDVAALTASSKSGVVI